MTAPAPAGLQVFPVTGIGQVRPGDDVAALILAACPDLVDGDVLVVTSKIISKAEGRLVQVPADPVGRDAARRALVEAQTVRLVAQYGRTKIVENPLGLVAAAAGVDSSNVPGDAIALLPVNPDASAAAIVAACAAAGHRVGVIITDTQGRAWREGLHDVAIGAAGIGVLADYRGSRDRHGNELGMTQVAVGDEIAAAADLVKGKLAQVPVAVVRGLQAPGGHDYDGGGQVLIRRHGDLFRLGTDLAIAQGRQEAARLVGPAGEFADGPVELAAVDDCVRAALAGHRHPESVLVLGLRDCRAGITAAYAPLPPVVHRARELLLIACAAQVADLSWGMFAGRLVIALAAAGWGGDCLALADRPDIPVCLGLPPGFRPVCLVATGPLMTAAVLPPPSDHGLVLR